MSYLFFWNLFDKLRVNIERVVLKRQNYTAYLGRDGPGNYLPPPIPNGPVCPIVRFAVSIRYFAGGLVYDLMAQYGVAHTDLFKSIWSVIDAVNEYEEFRIEYPKEHHKQEAVASGFCAVSAADFSVCAGALDGILIWINKPSVKDAKKSGIGRKMFFCGLKSKFGLNCQAVSDVRGRILDLSICYGGAAPDCVTFEGSDFFNRLESGIMKDVLCLFGDNAYVNASYMATPYPNAIRSRDDYNFYHSQLRIRVECAFGMLVNRWGILRMAMPMGISIQKTVAVVNALAKLHNYCLDDDDNSRNFPVLRQDASNIMLNPGRYVPMNVTASHDILVPWELMDLGNTGEDTSRVERQQSTRDRQRAADGRELLPCHKLRVHVINQQLRRPMRNIRR